MASLILPSPRVVQPQGPVEINWANPITRGLAWVGTPSSGGTTDVGTIGRSNGTMGRAWETTGVGSSWVSTGYNPPTTGPMTSMALADTRVLGGNRPCIAVGDRATIAWGGGSDVQFYTYDGSTWSGPTVAAPITDGPTLFVGRHTGTQNIISTRVLSGDSAGVSRTASSSVSPRSHSSLELTLGGEVENTGRTTEAHFFLGAFWNRALSDVEVRSLENNPWQLFIPIQRRIWVESAGATSHDSSGALVGAGSTVAGTAQHNVPHPSSGALTGPGSVVVGSAARTRAHPSSGDLIGPGSTVAGTAARTRQHASTGALTGSGSEVAGTAARTRQHASSGDLVGPGSEIVGSADHQAAAGVHDSTGALVGQGSTVAGSAARFRAFAASGALVGQGSEVVGSANHIGPAVSHDATGALVGPGAIVSGQAQNGVLLEVVEQPPTYVVGKPKKPKERKLMGGPRWQRHELEDLAKVVQTRPFESAKVASETAAEEQAQEAIAKASRQEIVTAFAVEADVQLDRTNAELAQAQQMEAAILHQRQIDQQMEDEAVMKIIAEML